MSIRIPGYQKLCETLKEGDLLEIVNESPNNQTLILDGNFYGHQTIHMDARCYEPQSFRLLPGESKFFVVEDVSLYEELMYHTILRTSLFVDRNQDNNQNRFSSWERFIRLRDTDYRLWWITSRTFVSLSDDRIQCFVNGKAI